MKTKHLIRSALLLALAGSAVWAASLGITLTNQWTHRVPLLLVDGELGSTNQLQYTPVLRETNAWQWLAEIVLTNHPTPYVDGTATNVPERYYRARQLDGGGPPTNAPRAPIYFNLFYHQEGVGSICTGLTNYQEWRDTFWSELITLDLRGVVSDQCLSDYMVEVIRHKDGINAPIFDRFSNSIAKLGYHFHPSSADGAIRTDRIRDREFWAAVQAYPTWERAYYDWSGCTNDLDCILCGSLDTNRPGGIQVMQAAFGKPCVVEHSSVGFAPVALALKAQYTNLVTGWAGGSGWRNLPDSWKLDWEFSPDPYRYAYKLMGFYRLRPHSMAFIEDRRLARVEQMLALLPRDRPHIVQVHGYSSYMTSLLDYLQQFMTNNPGSRFISAAELPDLVDTNRNARSYSMNDLQEGAEYLLRNWHGRPPAFIVTERKYLSLASFFMALQTVLRQYYAQNTWPTNVTVPDFVPPPLGDQTNLPSMDDWRTHLPVSVTNLAQIIQGLHTNEIPYVVEIPVPGGPGLTNPPVKIHAAELLNGMCTLLLKHRAGPSFSEICLFKGHIIPISNVPRECDSSRYQYCATVEPPLPNECRPCQPKATYADNRLDWYNQLQLWTLEPLDLRTIEAPQVR